MNNPSVQRQAFDRAIAAWNARDLTRYLELYGQRIALYGYSAIPMNTTEVRDFYEGVFASVSDIVLEIHEVVEDGSQLGCRFTLHGTHTGELFGMPATGQRIAQHGMTIMRFDGDRVVERHSVGNLSDVIAQLTG